MDATMRRERLEQLRRVVDSVPAEMLNQNRWWSRCGTAGCAIGWCAQDRYFRRQGLTLGMMKDREGEEQPVPMMNGHYAFHPELADFFGITKEESRFVFGGREAYGSKPRRGLFGSKKPVLHYKDQILNRIQALIDATPEGKAEGVEAVAVPESRTPERVS